jgi:hypothetical protein
VGPRKVEVPWSKDAVEGSLSLVAPGPAGSLWGTARLVKVVAIVLFNKVLVLFGFLDFRLFDVANDLERPPAFRTGKMTGGCE